MTFQPINLGSQPNDYQGDPLRVGGQKINENFAEIYASALIDPNLAEVTATGTTTPRTLANWLDDEINAKAVGAIGDGLVDDTTSLQSMFDKARDAGKPWYLPKGDYLVTAALNVYTSGRCDGRIVVANTGQSWIPVQVMPLAADVTSIPLATVNAWTGIVKDATVNAEWASYYGSTLVFYSDDETLLNRRNTTGFYFRDVVVIDDPVGTFYPPLMKTKSATWTAPNAFVTATRNRAPIVIDGLCVAFTSGSGEATGGILVQRSNTTLRSPSVINTSSGKVLQGVQIAYASGVTIYDGYVEGMNENTTNYAYNIGTAACVTLVNCREVFCRRGVDCQPGKKIRVIGGEYPDGVGAHWVSDFDVSLAAIASDSPNTAPIWVSGRDVSVHHNHILVRSDQFSCIGVRDDIFECAGNLRLESNNIMVDCSASASTDRTLVSVVPGTSAAFDYGRQLKLPDYIAITGNKIRQLNASFTGRINCVNLLGTGSTTNPSGISGGGKIVIRDNAFDLEAGALHGDSTPLVGGLFLSKILAYNAGSGYEVLLDGLPSVQMYLWCDPAHSFTSTLRANVVSKNVGTMLWQGSYGAFLHADLGADSINVFGTSRPSASFNTPIGDEIEVYRSILDLSQGLGITTDATTARTLALVDAGKTIRFTSASGIALTVPPNASVAFPGGTIVNVRQAGSGQITFTPGAAVTINSRPGLKSGGQFAGATLEKVATNEWDLSGDLTS